MLFHLNQSNQEVGLEHVVGTASDTFFGLALSNSVRRIVLARPTALYLNGVSCKGIATPSYSTVLEPFVLRLLSGLETVQPESTYCGHFFIGENVALTHLGRLASSVRRSVS